MKVIIVSNCTTRGYYNAVTALFPHWEVRAAGIRESERWLETGEKPDFSRYIKQCDLYIGLPIEGRLISNELKSSSERVIIPELYFRGLHPDIFTLRDFRGPFTINNPDTQTSLIALGARAIGKSAQETEALFCEETYQRLGFFDLYKSEKDRLISNFSKEGILIGEMFKCWEERGDFFHICHHPRAFVLFDILRCSLKGRYLSDEAFESSEELRDSQQDTLSSTEVWPVYPEIARRLGFAGSLTWLMPKSQSPREMSLSEVIRITFDNLETADESWKSNPSIRACAALLGSGF